MLPQQVFSPVVTDSSSILLETTSLNKFIDCKVFKLYSLGDVGCE